MSVNRAKQTQAVRDWNASFKPGTEVEYQGRLRKTWSPAGLVWAAKAYEPGVFLDGEPSCPVLLSSLTVPGWDKKKGEFRGRK